MTTQPIQTMVGTTSSSRWRRAGFWGAVCAGLVALVMAAGYIARTELVLGPLVSAKLEALAEQRKVELRVGSMRPVSWDGIRFEQVQLVARRGPYAVAADLDAVDVFVSVSAFFERGQLHPESVEVHGGDIVVMRRPEGQPEAAEPTEPSPTSAPAAPTATKPEPKPARPALKTQAVLHDIAVSVQPGPLPGATRPLVLHRAKMVLTPRSTASGVDFRRGYGRLPDGTSFSMRKRHNERGQAVYTMSPDHPTRIDRWFVRRSPLELSVAGVTICPECAPARVDLERVELRAPHGISTRTPRVSVWFGQQQVGTELPGIELSVGDQVLPYRVHTVEVVYDGKDHLASVQGQLFDGRSGKASVQLSWSRERDMLAAELRLDRFQAAGIWEQLGLEELISGGVFSGQIESSLAPNLGLLEASVDLNSELAAVSMPPITHDWIAFERVDVAVDLLAHPATRSVSITEGELYVGQAGPVAFEGYAIGARPGWAWDLRAWAHEIDPQRLRDGLPLNLAQLTEGAELEGAFGFEVTSAGHTAWPESISLAVDFSGDVQVLGDSYNADVAALAAEGPPSIELSGRAKRRIEPGEWSDYDTLPAYVPRVLTAAEDARFFEHGGFDWKGLRRALVHNVRAGGIVRGGSTLSQQLSKNLFLAHDRTLARKLQEAYVTWRLESELSKERILELYMNLVDFGPNLRGLRQASQRYFDVAPEELSVAQTTLLASMLPGPSLFGQQVLGGYLPSSRVEKIEHILSNLRFLDVITGAEYRTIYADAKAGRIGGLELTVCDDDGKAPPGAPNCW